MRNAPSTIEVREARGHTVVRFDDSPLQDDDWLCEARAEVDALVNARQLKTLSFELRGIENVPSTVLSLFVIVRNKGLKVRLLNPSHSVREKLNATRLDTVLEVVGSS